MTELLNAPWGDEPATPAPEDERAAYIRGLREIAAWLEAHPEIRPPYLTATDRTDGRETLTVYLWDDTRAALAAAARALAEGGHEVHKAVNTAGDGFYVWRPFGGLALEIRAPRGEVCERVQVGVKPVEVRENSCPVCHGDLTTADPVECATDPGHYRAVRPGVRVSKVDEPVYEWRCAPLLAADGGGS